MSGTITRARPGHPAQSPSSPFGSPRKRRQITLKREMPALDSCGSPDPKASAKANTKGGPVHWEKYQVVLVVW